MIALLWGRSRAKREGKLEKLPRGEGNRKYTCQGENYTNLSSVLKRLAV